MATFVQRVRARLRVAVRLGGQLAELFDFLGMDFLAQLARAALFAALAALFLLDLLVRATFQLAVLTFRFLGRWLWQLVRAATVFWMLALVTQNGAFILESDYTKPVALSHGQRYPNQLLHRVPYGCITVNT